ncbi:hypothetical protein FZW96_02625 [Bacillus sp. BGMRC 2118]|nr:hypothetical protein FZW96_02625 [Bacillus sp. BGMRC 2118]
MTYVINNANVKKENELITCSLSVKNNKIEYIKSHMNNVNFMKMDVSPYLLTPGHVMLDFKIEQLTTIQSFKEHMKQLVRKGCTTALVGVSVKYESELKQKVKKIQQHMINSPIDYCICIKVPIRALTPSLIRQCKRLKIPAIFVELKEEELYSTVWGWIRESLYPYFLSIIPIWTADYSKNKSKRLTAEWKGLLEEEKIPTVPICPKEGEPLAVNVLRKIGISPLKGELRIGGDVDYNLYKRKSREFANQDEVNYDMDSPVITVHKGRNIKVGNEFYINPGYGDQLCIKVPGFYSATFE